MLPSLVWREGSIPDSQEADVPEGADAFEIARELRNSDPQAAYACFEREGAWLVVAMPDEPPAAPAQSSEPVSASVWRTRVAVYAHPAPQVRAEYVLTGPSREYVESLCRKLANIAPNVINVSRGAVAPVDFGDDFDPSDPVNGLHPSWADDGSNESATVEAIGGIVKYVRRVYPRCVPTNEQLARELARIFNEEA